jgi:hypothetical protein
MFFFQGRLFGVEDFIRVDEESTDVVDDEAKRKFN